MEIGFSGIASRESEWDTFEMKWSYGPWPDRSGPTITPANLLLAMVPGGSEGLSRPE